MSMEIVFIILCTLILFVISIYLRFKEVSLMFKWCDLSAEYEKKRGAHSADELVGDLSLWSMDDAVKIMEKELEQGEG